MKNKYSVNWRNKELIELEDILVDSKLDEENKVNDSFNSENIKKIEKIFFVILLMLFLQTGYLQIIKGGYYSKISQKNYTRTSAIKSARGIIYDRNQKQIVFNVPVFDLVIIPFDFLKDKNKTEEKISALSKIIELDSLDLDAINLDAINRVSTSFQPFLILGNISKEEALIIEEEIKELDGVKLERNAIRNYIDGNYLSNIVGYNGRVNQNELAENPDYLLNDIIGKNGLELFYEKQLRGKYGRREIEVDSFGREIKLIRKENPQSGNNLVLNIDFDLQKKIYEELEKITVKIGTEAGASAVAINPKNGAVLALVSFPSYDNNLFAGGISDSEYQQLINNNLNPLFNRAVSGEYPPGSTIKPLIGAAALQEKIISPQKIIIGGAAIYVGAYQFLDWKIHGPVDLAKAIAQSCNIYFYTVGGGYGETEGLGIDRIKKYSNLFGLGTLLNIDLPGEKQGLVPNKEWKKNVKNERWYIGDTYHVSIGQGDILTTPLQIANYTATIANGGKLLQPQIVDKIINDDGDLIEDIKPKIIRDNFIDLENIKWIQKGMRENVIYGSGVSLSALPIEVAGKTGTAQYAANQKTHAWYTSYAPYDDPEIVLTVIIEDGGEGHAAAVPVVKEVLGWYFDGELRITN
ncbi:MAG: penicillin-binding protein 2 [Candidatus Pacebacteria bacterium]|nr:penicillin-binding protein 2 [Candidatus Paceibacterota bacterium]